MYGMHTIHCEVHVLFGKVALEVQLNTCFRTHASLDLWQTQSPNLTALGHAAHVPSLFLPIHTNTPNSNPSNLDCCLSRRCKHPCHRKRFSARVRREPEVCPSWVSEQLVRIGRALWGSAAPNRDMLSKSLTPGSSGGCCDRCTPSRCKPPEIQTPAESVLRNVLQVPGNHCEGCSCRRRPGQG